MLVTWYDAPSARLLFRRRRPPPPLALSLLPLAAAHGASIMCIPHSTVHTVLSVYRVLLYVLLLCVYSAAAAAAAAVVCCVLFCIYCIWRCVRRSWIYDDLSKNKTGIYCTVVQYVYSILYNDMTGICYYCMCTVYMSDISKIHTAIIHKVK